MKPMDLVRKLRRDAAFEPSARYRGGHGDQQFVLFPRR